MFMKANGYGAQNKLTGEIQRLITAVKDTQESF